MKANTHFCAYFQLSSRNIYLSVETRWAKSVQNVGTHFFYAGYALYANSPFVQILKKKNKKETGKNSREFLRYA